MISGTFGILSGMRDKALISGTIPEFPGRLVTLGVCDRWRQVRKDEDIVSIYRWNSSS
jgi:hypothetical protein